MRNIRGGNLVDELFCEHALCIEDRCVRVQWLYEQRQWWQCQVVHVGQPEENGYA